MSPRQENNPRPCQLAAHEIYSLLGRNLPFEAQATVNQHLQIEHPREACPSPAMEQARAAIASKIGKLSVR